jgi:hypothetical protein
VKKIILPLFLALMLIPSVDANALRLRVKTKSVSLAGCVAGIPLSPNVPLNGGFLWKPVAAHFTRAVVITPHFYYPTIPGVELISNDHKRSHIAFGTVKSTGACDGNPECFGAASFLFPSTGSTYQRNYRSGVIVKVSGRAKGCRYYTIKAPASRASFRGN